MSHPVGVDQERCGLPGGDLCDRAQWVGVLQGALQFGVADQVGLLGFAAAGVADGALAFLIGPAGAVGDDLCVVGGE